MSLPSHSFYFYRRTIRPRKGNPQQGGTIDFPSNPAQMGKGVYLTAAAKCTRKASAVRFAFIFAHALVSYLFIALALFIYLQERAREVRSAYCCASIVYSVLLQTFITLFFITLYFLSDHQADSSFLARASVQRKTN